MKVVLSIKLIYFTARKNASWFYTNFVFLQPKHSSLEKRLKNTFGWARVDVLVMLIGCVVFCSLCFSSVIEAIQILLHISHHDEAHSPIVVFAIGAFGLVLNGLAYVLIGGKIHIYYYIM